MGSGNRVGVTYRKAVNKELQKNEINENWKAEKDLEIKD
jgi:hypothetical protein